MSYTRVGDSTHYSCHSLHVKIILQVLEKKEEAEGCKHNHFRVCKSRNILFQNICLEKATERMKHNKKWNMVVPSVMSHILSWQEHQHFFALLQSVDGLNMIIIKTWELTCSIWSHFVDGLYFSLGFRNWVELENIFFGVL